ncbi:MAG: peptidoglycan DD-metalloendopeptidase family protein [Microbacterium sp.]
MAGVVEAEASGFELLEPVDVPAPAAFVASTAEPEASAPHDPFEAAARLFSFTGEVPVPEPVAAGAESEAAPEPVVAEAAPAHVASRSLRTRAPRRRRGSASFRRAAGASFSVGAMAVAGLLAVGMTTPAAALASVTEVEENPATSVLAPGETELAADDIQAYVAPAQVENVELDREGGYAIASLEDIAKADGINNTSSLFTNDPTAAIQWPFPVGVPMSWGYGMRWGSMHTGIDLTPGDGAKIQAIADGVVRSASDATGGYGVNIYIDHIIDGQLVTSHYAHMQYGSMRVKTGDTVKAGQIIGLVGNTGHSFGSHLHFEILLNGTQLIDPLPWMRANAGRHSLD